MAVPSESRPNPTFIDRRTWLRTGDAIASLASKQARPYFLNESFLASEHTQRPDAIIGDGFELGDLTEGHIKLFVLNGVGTALAAEVGNEYEYLTEQLIFGKEEAGNEFSGDMRFYSYANGEGQIAIRAAGRIVNPDPDLAFRFSTFANQVGLSRMWRDMTDQAATSEPSPIDMMADVRTAQDIARALVRLDGQIPPRP